MAIKPKTATFQIRIDPDLLERFQAQCADREVIPSDLVRKFIRGQSDHWAKQAAEAARKTGQGVGATQPEKTAVSPVKTSGKGVH